jgi:hypothetical protein
MPDDNRISATLAAADKTTIMGQLAQARTLLPFLLNLTPEERKQMFKLGDKSVGFDEKCKSYMAANTSLVPGFVSTAEQEKDRVLRLQLLDIYHEVAAFAEALDDTITVLGTEILMADLSFYQSVRQAAKRGTPVGVDAIYQDLQQRFPFVRKQPAVPVPTP